MHCLWILLSDIDPVWSIFDDPVFFSLVVTCRNRGMNPTPSSVSKHDHSRFLLDRNSHLPVFWGPKGTWGCRPHFLRTKLWPRSPARPPCRKLGASGQTGRRHRWGCLSPWPLLDLRILPGRTVPPPSGLCHWLTPTADLVRLPSAEGLRWSPLGKSGSGPVPRRKQRLCQWWNGGGPTSSCLEFWWGLMLKITEVTGFVVMLHQHVWSWQNKTKSEVGHIGWTQPEIHSYLLYLWRDGLPSGHRDVFLQRGHTAGWVVNSLISVIVCGAFPSRWNGPSSKSLFYSLESCRTSENVLLCYCSKQQAGWVQSNLQFGGRISLPLE